ncbi:MAG: OmpA family protein [Bacteroidia bacterium]|nr:OmpA family protein [Bacteroidia bacterium]
MKNIFIPLVVFTGISINISAQEKAVEEVYGERNLMKYSISDNVEKSHKELKGDKQSFNYSYDKAIEKYTHTKNLSVEGQRRLAEAYHNTVQNIEAEIAYSKLINRNEELFPEDYYNYAMVLKANGKYEESNKWMIKFSDLKPTDLRAISFTENSGTYSNLINDSSRYLITHMDINTLADDFGSVYYKNGIVFSSTISKPKMIVRKYNWTGKPFWDMYVSDVEDGQLKKPKKFDRGLNKKFHDGPASFSNEGNSMAFTRNHYNDKSKDKVVELQIWFSNFKDKKWSKPEPFILNSFDYSVGQPSLTSNGNTMYFTSDMSGGFGGSDIYKVTKNEKGEWGNAVNMGNKINTEGDEMFPFFEEKNEVLFFASNGLYGLGGLDIFMCPMIGSKQGKVYNAGAPLNSQYDDFAVISDNNLAKGYFTSNRSYGSGGDDIYSVAFNSLEIGKKIIGNALDIDSNLLSNTFIKLIDEQSNFIDTVTTGSDAAFSFLVESNKNYKIFGKKENYKEGDSIASTFGKEFIVKADVILLKKEETIIPKTFEEKLEVGKDLGKILEFDPKTIYFDYGKYNIRQDAVADLNEIVRVMNEYPEMTIELGSHTDCRGTEKFNQTLSENRAKSSASYIKSRITKPERIYGKGYGETKLVNACSCEGTVVSECSEEEHQNNRRTEFIIIVK